MGAKTTIVIAGLALLVELAWSKRSGRRVYSFGDSVNNLSTNLLSMVVGLPGKILSVWIFAQIVEHLSVQKWLGAPSWPRGALAWGVGLLLFELNYYWVHRLSHAVRYLWASHGVHHSSGEYNLSVALRNSALQSQHIGLLYAPLAFIGMPVSIFVGCYMTNLIWAFWIHTRFVGSLGPLEALLMTPSAHRVHHGVEDGYRDRNFGGVLVIWDRLFGTYVPETAEPTYGLLHPFRSTDPVWTNLHLFAAIWRDIRASRNASEVVRALFGRPGTGLSWTPAPTESAACTPVPLAGPQTSAESADGLDRGVRAYLTAQLILLSAIVGGGLTAFPGWPLAGTLAFGALVVFATLNFGALLRAAVWGWRGEALRHLVTLVFLWSLRETLSGAEFAVATIASVLSFGWCVALSLDQRQRTGRVPVRVA